MKIKKKIKKKSGSKTEILRNLEAQTKRLVSYKKNTPKLSQNQRSELKETKKMKVVQLHERTPKQLSNPTPTQK